MRLTYCALFTLAVMIAACSGESTSEVPSPRLTSLSVVLSANSIIVGTSAAATAVGRDQNGQQIAVGVVSWISSNSAVASVDAGGQVRGIAPGNATITGTASGITASVAISVTPAPALARLEITAISPTVRSGDRVTTTVAGFDQFNAPIAPSTVSWTSSSPTVAVAEADGRILGVLIGTAIVTARSGTVSATTSITVTAGNAAKLVVARAASGIFNNWRFGVQPQIEIADAAGNRIASDNTTAVQLTSTPGVVGITTATATSGLATFENAGSAASLGTNATLTFSATGLAPTTQSITIAPFSFGNGVRLIGFDVRPGRYRSINNAAASCYWARLRNTTGSNDIIANDLGSGPRLVEVLATDVAIESSGCLTWVEFSGPVTTSRTAPFFDGT